MFDCWRKQRVQSDQLLLQWLIEESTIIAGRQPEEERNRDGTTFKDFFGGRKREK